MSSPRKSKPAVLIVVEASALARWVRVLADALAKDLNADVSLRVVDTGAPETALSNLLSLERMVLQGHRPTWTDRLPRADIAELLEGADEVAPDIVVDLRHQPDSGWPSSTLILCPSYNGGYGETALSSALFFSGTPRIEIVANKGDADPFIAAEGVASLEAANGTGGAMEAVWSRVIALILKAHAATDGETAALAPRAPRPIGKSDLAKYGAKAVARAAAYAAYRLCCHAPHWRVGWRRPGKDGDVWSRRDLGGARWNVLADPGDHFYADPFPAHRDGRDFLFFEDLDHKTGKGIISVVTFGEEGQPGEVMPVLEEPWHLSYPFLIEEDGEFYMIPEASLSGEISIYRAENFPHGWTKAATLVESVEAADATIVKHGGRYFMFAVVRDGVGGYSDTLAIWHAPKLFGPWTAHAGNPIMIDDRSARPAGNMVMRDGTLWRPVQDCRAGYGAALGLARVEKLTTKSFSQEVQTILRPDSHWPGRKLHTLNYNGRIETVDGSVIRPKAGFLADIVDARSAPKDQ